MVKNSRFILFFFLLGPFLILKATPGLPQPEKGILDLRNSGFDAHTLVRLDGEWLFHWESLLDPQNPPESGQGTVVKIPSYWQGMEVDEKKLPGMGYGTYELTVILPENYERAICFDIPLFDVAYRFYLNDYLVAESGQVGQNREEEDPWYDPASFCYMPDQDSLMILIQVSNFHHRRGGFWQSVFMGGSEPVLAKMERRRMYNYSTIGVLFFFSFFFLIFWIARRNDPILLLFALTTLGILMRSVNTGLYFSNAFVQTSWSWQIRMEYLGSYLAALFGLLFLHKLFPRAYMKWPIRLYVTLFLLASLSLFLLPVHLFSYEMLFYQPLLVLMLAHYLFLSLRGSIKGQIKDLIFFISLSLFIFTLVNDILLANSAGSVYRQYFTQISFQVFIFSMAILVILQWLENDRLRQNLESSLRFKNRVLSVIAHDLKNPVANIAQFAELLESKPGLSSNQKVLSSLSESSQAAVNLLDNLLYWGRTEDDRLSVKAADILLQPIIDESLSLFKHQLAQKELELSTETEAGLKAYADPVHVRVILRNLISNAIKFTPKKGRIQLRTWRQEEGACFSVSDTGVGIPEKILHRFRKEGRLISSRGTNQEIGTGLGLQLIKEMVQENKGQLKIESKAGEGSLFTIILPETNPNHHENTKTA